MSQKSRNYSLVISFYLVSQLRSCCLPNLFITNSWYLGRGLQISDVFYRFYECCYCSGERWNTPDYSVLIKPCRKYGEHVWTFFLIVLEVSSRPNIPIQWEVSFNFKSLQSAIENSYCGVWSLDTETFVLSFSVSETTDCLGWLIQVLSAIATLYYLCTPATKKGIHLWTA